MKKVLIFSPKRFNEIPNIFFKSLINEIYKLKNNYKKIFCNKDNYKQILSSNKIDIVFMPRGYGLTEFSSYGLNSNILKVSFMDDLHYHNDETKDKLHRLFSFSDIILLTYYQNFLRIKEFKKFYKKACLFPFSSIFFNEQKSSSLNKILISGRASSSYPFRRFLIDYSKKIEFCERLSHPGYFGLKHNIIGKKYYNFLSNYKASVVTTAKHPINYTVLKYFEIPSCNIIPIFQKTNFLKDFGFIKNFNYIEINEKNYKRVLNINFLLENENVRQNSYDLVVKYHNIKNRVSLFYNILDKEMPVNWELK